MVIESRGLATTPANIKLDEHQLDAATSDAAPLLLLAGPGSGKTEVLIQRVLWRYENDSGFDPRRALVATFTRQASQELWVRLRAAGVRNIGSLGTIHSAALSQIRQYEQSRNSPPHKVLANRRDLITELITDSSGNRGKSTAGGGRSQSVNQICAEIDWAQARGITPKQYAEQDGPSRIGDARAQAVASLFGRFQSAKRKRRLLDFDDVLTRCCQLIESDKGFAAQLRWSFIHFFVDEFQDINPTQFELLKAWLGDRTDLFAVGDPNQSIYGWNGAEPGYLTEFETFFPGATTLRLEVNRRSTPVIVKAAETVLGIGDDNTLGTAQTCLAHSGVVPSFSGYGNKDAEAVGVAELLRSGLASSSGSSGGLKNSWAVLARNHAHLRRVMKALDDAGIACKLAGARTLLSRPEAVKLRKDLTSAHDFSTELRDQIAELADPNFELAELEETGETEQVDALTEPQKPAKPSEPAGERSRAFNRVLELALQYVREYQHKTTGAGFDSWLSELTPYDIDPAESSHGVVDLVTFHAAKGLQWRHVIVSGASKGTVPTGRNDPEERRLLYVAMTRAKETLHFTWDDARGRSPLLDEIQAAIAQEPLATEEERSEGLAMARAALSKLAETAGAQPETTEQAGTPGRTGLLVSELASGVAPGRDLAVGSGLVGVEIQQERRKQLELWRKNAARSYELDADVVMEDKVLSVIAQNGLGTLEALAEATGLSTVRLARLHEALSTQLQEVLAGSAKHTDGDDSTEPVEPTGQLDLKV